MQPADGRSGPLLVAVAHGSRSPAAQAGVLELLDVVRSLRPGLRVREAYVELAEPSLPHVLRAADGERIVVVPLLLGGGYHVAHDVAGVTAAYRPDARVAGALGPDPLLVEALAARLAEAGAGSGTVVLAAAGSSDPRAHGDSAVVARMLAVRLGLPVLPAYASGPGLRLGDAVGMLRAAGAGRVCVATYLLSPGRFAAEVRACGADVVAEPLGAHPALGRLVLARYDAARRAPVPA